MTKRSFDLIVIGAGPAGSMCAVKAAERGNKVLIIDKNQRIGGKIPITGNSRCNITNENISLENYVGKNRDFVRNVFALFSTSSLIEFFRESSVGLYREKDRYYPLSGKSITVVEALETKLKKNNVDFALGATVVSAEKSKSVFTVESASEIFISKALAICTGGKSYSKAFGSGGGFSLAQHFGHSLTPMNPGLTSFLIKDNIFKSLAGVSTEATLSLISGKKNIYLKSGPILFTHFGISGPVVMDCSNRLAQLELQTAEISIDFLNNAFSDFETFYREISFYPKNSILKLISRYIPNSLARVVLRNLSIYETSVVSSIKKTRARELHDFLTANRITAHLNKNFEEGQVTVGGVKTDEINPKTMESKKVKNLYFAGEVLDIAGDCGGYNLQFAFSTGYIAGNNL